MLPRRNPIARALILRKGGVHSKSRSAERTQAKKILKKEVENWTPQRFQREPGLKPIWIYV